LYRAINSIMRVILNSVLLIFILSIFSVERSSAQYSSSSCLPKFDTNQMIKEKKVVSPAPLIKDAKSRYKGEVVNIQLCNDGDNYIFFYVVILEPTGKVRFVAYNAKDGQFYKVL
jgi:uncharacterized membrane protein YkoI